MLDSMSPEQLANNNLRDKYRYFMHHTDQLEMKQFFGLCYMKGLQEENYSDCDILWDDGIGHPISAATMSKDRFKFLNRFICFDDRTTRIERTKTDKFAPFRELFEKWNERCSTVRLDFLSRTEVKCLLANLKMSRVLNTILQVLMVSSCWRVMAGGSCTVVT